MSRWVGDWKGGNHLKLYRVVVGGMAGWLCALELTGGRGSFNCDNRKQRRTRTTKGSSFLAYYNERNKFAMKCNSMFRSSSSRGTRAIPAGRRGRGRCFAPLLLLLLAAPIQMNGWGRGVFYGPFQSDGHAKLMGMHKSALTLVLNVLVDGTTIPSSNRPRCSSSYTSSSGSHYYALYRITLHLSTRCYSNSH